MKQTGRYKEIRMGHTSQKILLLLFGGFSLGLTSNPKYFFKTLDMIAKEWKEIDRRALRRAIKNLYTSKLVDAKDNPDETTSIVLTQKGKQVALRYHIDEMRVLPMKRWDKKWRIVLFDIPERYKKARDALALTLKRMGFYRIQKSVFVHPYECQNEIDFVIEFWNVRPYVRTILAEHIDNELYIKSFFKL